MKDRWIDSMDRRHRTAVAAVFCATALPLALACQGGDAGGEAGMETGGEQGTMESAPTSTRVPFSDLNESGVTGDAEFTLEGGSLEVAVLANNLGGPGDYPSHIHEGSCADPGDVAVPLDAAVAHEPGIGEAETDVEVNQLEAGGSYVVLVHALQGQPVACAEIPASLLQGES